MITASIIPQGKTCEKVVLEKRNYRTFATLDLKFADHEGNHIGNLTIHFNSVEDFDEFAAKLTSEPWRSTS